MVSGTVIFRLLSAISGVAGLFLDVKGGLRNSFLITDYEDDYGTYQVCKTRFKHRKEFLYFEK